MDIVRQISMKNNRSTVCLKVAICHNVIFCYSDNVYEFSYYNYSNVLEFNSWEEMISTCDRDVFINDC